MEFYAHAAMADGHLSFCKACVRARVTRHRSEHLDAIRLHDRQRGRTEANRARVRRYYAANPDKSAGSKQKWAARNRHKIAAHSAVNNAIRDGRLEKLPCRCGECAVEGHHPDYGKPLEVIWLCEKHHKEEHRKYKEQV